LNQHPGKDGHNQNKRQAHVFGGGGKATLPLGGKDVDAKDGHKGKDMEPKAKRRAPLMDHSNLHLHQQQSTLSIDSDNSTASGVRMVWAYKETGLNSIDFRNCPRFESIPPSEQAQRVAGSSSKRAQKYPSLWRQGQARMSRLGSEPGAGLRPSREKWGSTESTGKSGELIVSYLLLSATTHPWTTV